MASSRVSSPANGDAAKFSLPYLVASILASGRARHFVGHVAVRLADGRRLEETQDHPRGGPDSPMTREELTAKFHANAALALPAARGARVAELVDALAAQPGVGALVDALTP